VIREIINLTEIFRQKDQRFVDMLNRFRIGLVLKKDEVRSAFLSFGADRNMF
jgi:hypothetical protein